MINFYNLTIYEINTKNLQNMKLIDYLDWPKIPDELILSNSDIISKSVINRQKLNNIYFHPKKLDNNLYMWIVDQILKPIDLHDSKFIKNIQYQVIYPNIPIHIDSEDRKIAINYLLDTGGKNSSTQLFDRDRNLIEEKNIEPFKWHYLLTSIPHTVANIETIRVSISISFNQNGQSKFISDLKNSKL